MEIKYLSILYIKINKTNLIVSIYGAVLIYLHTFTTNNMFSYFMKNIHTLQSLQTPLIIFYFPEEISSPFLDASCGRAVN